MIDNKDLITTAERARLYLEEISHLSKHTKDYESISQTAEIAISELKEALDAYYASLK